MLFLSLFLSLLSFPPFIAPPFLLWHSKSGDLEEELKNVTNNLKSLEAQAEKVGNTGIAGGCVSVKSHPNYSAEPKPMVVWVTIETVTEALSGTVLNQKACLQHNRA